LGLVSPGEPGLGLVPVAWVWWRGVDRGWCRRVGSAVGRVFVRGGFGR